MEEGKVAAEPGGGFLGNDECKYEGSAYNKTEICTVAGYVVKPEGGYDHPGVVELLLEAGAPVAPANNGFTPIWMAVVMKLPPALRLLLKRAKCSTLKRVVETADSNEVLLPLAAHPHPMKDVCRELIKAQRAGEVAQSGGHGVEFHDVPNMVNNWLCTQEEVGLFVNRLNADMIAELVAGFARCAIKIDLDFSDGGVPEPPLSSAARNGNLQSAELLLSLGAKTMSANVLGQTPLHIAALSGHGDIAVSLLQAAKRRSDLEALLASKDVYGRIAGDHAAAGPCSCLLSGPLLQGDIDAVWEGCSRGGAGDTGSRAMDGGPEEMNRGVPEHEAKRASASPPPFEAGTPSGWRRYTGTPPFAKVGNAAAAGVSAGIAQVDGAISAETFVKDFVSVSRPAIFRGAAANMTALTDWTPGFLSSVTGSAGPAAVQASTVPYGNMDGVAIEQMALRDYINEMLAAEPFLPHDNVEAPPPYVFDSLDELGYLQHVELGEGKAEFYNVSMVSLTQALRTQLILGPPGTGSPPHFHTSAINIGVAGRKRWFLFPPSERIWSAKPVSAWLKDDCAMSGRGAPLEVIQGPGDIIYVPENYGHAVINLDDTLAVAIEFKHLSDNPAQRSRPAGNGEDGDVATDGGAANVPTYIDAGTLVNDEDLDNATPFPQDCMEAEKQRTTVIACIQSVAEVGECVDSKAGNPNADMCACFTMASFVKCAATCWPWLKAALCPHVPTDGEEGKGTAGAADNETYETQQEQVGALHGRGQGTTRVEDDRSQTREQAINSDDGQDEVQAAAAREGTTRARAGTTLPEEGGSQEPAAVKLPTATLRDVRDCSTSILRERLQTCIKSDAAVLDCITDENTDDCKCLETESFAGCAGNCAPQLRRAICN